MNFTKSIYSKTHRFPDFEKVKLGALCTTYFCHSKKVDCVSIFNMQYTE